MKWSASLLIWHLNTGSAFMDCYEWYVLRTKSGKSMRYKWWGLTTESEPVGWDYRSSLCSQSVLLFTLIRNHGQLQKNYITLASAVYFRLKWSIAVSSNDHNLGECTGICTVAVLISLYLPLTSQYLIYMWMYPFLYTRPLIHTWMTCCLLLSNSPVCVCDCYYWE